MEAVQKSVSHWEGSARRPGEQGGFLVETVVVLLRLAERLDLDFLVLSVQLADQLVEIFQLFLRPLPPKTEQYHLKRFQGFPFETQDYYPLE